VEVIYPKVLNFYPKKDTNASSLLVAKMVECWKEKNLVLRKTKKAESFPTLPRSSTTEYGFSFLKITHKSAEPIKGID
jgi:hypothetical protein